jgi:hypothetical protein
MIFSRRLTALMIFLLLVTLAAFAFAIQGVRLGQQRITRNVTQVTRRITQVDAVVSRSPCTNITSAVCLQRLIASSTATQIARLRGPRGFTGPRGRTGATGATGATGMRGPAGVGTSGAAGADGQSGNAGATGVRGPQGPIGPQGPKGDTGVSIVQVAPAPPIVNVPLPVPDTTPPASPTTACHGNGKKAC